MATDQLMAPIPSLHLGPGMVIKLEAVSATTGLAVAGVKVKSIVVSGIRTPPVAANAVPPNPGPYMLVPGPDA